MRMAVSAMLPGREKHLMLNARLLCLALTGRKACDLSFPSGN
jgi:hypothetical protein